MVPEALFHPSDIGIRQSGIGECAGSCLQSFSPGVRELLARNIVLSGGTSCIPKFKARFEYPYEREREKAKLLNPRQEIAPYIETEKTLRVFQMNE